MKNLVFILLLMLVNQSAHTMDRKRIRENNSSHPSEGEYVKRPREREENNSTIPKVSLVQFLTEFYSAEQTVPCNVFDALITKFFGIAFKSTKSTVSSLWLEIPSPTSHPLPVTLLLTHIAKKGERRLEIGVLDGERQEDKVEPLLSYVMMRRKIVGKVLSESSLLLCSHVDSLVRLITRGKGCVFAGPPIMQENSISREEFAELIETYQSSSLVDKIFVLNNGNLSEKNDLPLWVTIKNNVSFRFCIKVAEYESNCLSEENFIAKTNLNKKRYYYDIRFILWDCEKQEEQTAATVFLRIALDQGRGRTFLPSELMWLQNEEGISGKEVLEFAMAVAKFLSPKALYLLDSADVGPTPLKISRPVWKKESFYRTYGHFELQSTTTLKSHDGIVYKQNPLYYEDAVNYLHNFDVNQLPSITKGTLRSRCIELLERYPEAQGKTLSQLIDHAFKKSAADFEFLTTVLLSPNNDEKLISAPLFVSSIGVLNNACLWVREFQ